MIEAFESVFSYRMRLFIARDRYTATCNMAVRRAVFEAVGPFVGIAVAEDVDWGQRASARGYRLAYVPEVRVATRARASFAELARKWDRHIAHDFAVVPPGAKGRLRWIARALMIAASPLAEIPHIATTDLLAGLWSRLLRLRRGGAGAPLPGAADALARRRGRRRRARGALAPQLSAGRGRAAFPRCNTRPPFRRALCFS